MRILPLSEGTKQWASAVEVQLENFLFKVIAKESSIST